MSGNSNVGSASVYEAKDQRPVPTKNSDNMDDIAKQFHEGKVGSHKPNDPSTFCTSSYTHASFTPLWDFPLPYLMICALMTSTDVRAHSTEDERSIANRLAKETEEGEPEDEKSREAELGKIDPTLPAKSHGNQPSKGALIDKEIQDEEAESKSISSPSESRKFWGKKEGCRKSCRRDGEVDGCVGRKGKGQERPGGM